MYIFDIITAKGYRAITLNYLFSLYRLSHVLIVTGPMTRFLSTPYTVLPSLARRVSILLGDYGSTVIIAISSLQAIRYLG